MSTSSLSGRRLAGYEVGSLLGAGGMGEVYRARDSKLNREVAIKILLPEVAGDADRLARFQREAQVLASLNHPNIAHIHGIEEGEAGPFLVMELVDGPTLADRIAQGPMAIDEALAIARQVADALEGAHERGVVHRDLKPANIKVSDDGAVKVLDFGLAKALDQGAGIGEQGSGGVANSPTITTPAMTVAGMILGTAAYMSPEQAKGRVVDKRSDVWAFGCVLYEMLTAKRAFEGEDVTDTIAAVVRGEPNWSGLPPDLPPQIRLLLKRCLEKDRRARISDIGVARFLMNETIAPGPSAPAQAGAPRSRRPLIAAASLGLVGGAAVLALAVWMLQAPPAAARPMTFAIVQPEAGRLAIQGNDRDLAIAADGSHIVYRSRLANRGDGVPFQLSVRALDHLESRALDGTAGARFPFFSPDGRWIGYFASGELRKISIDGGPSILLCRFGDGTPRGASWGDDGAIVFATLGPKGLLRVPADGGEPLPLFPIDGTDLTHRFPAVLPGSTAVLFTSGDGASVQTHVMDLTTGQRKTLIRGSDAVYVDPGYLVFVAAPSETMTDRFRTGSLLAVRFDLKRLEVLGDPFPVSDELLTLITGAGEYSVSGNGTLVYVPPDVERQDQGNRSLVWVNRKGQEEALRGAPVRVYATPRISPDGSRVVIDIRDQGNDIWIWDLKRETLTPLNRDPAVDMSPQWTPDGRRIVWTSSRVAGTPNLYWQLADGTGAIERLTTTPGNQFPTSITPDGSRVLLFGSSGATGMDIFTVALSGSDRKQAPLLQLPSQDFGPEVSPDGRWLAYHSTESGESQVYVRPYPNVDAGRWPISTTGGSRAAWARNGRELFYLDDTGVLTSVTVQAKGEAFSASAPAKVLNAPYFAGTTTLGLSLRGYDVSPDGQRFLMIKEIGAAGDQPSRPLSRIVVVLNWFEELKARTAAR